MSKLDSPSLEFNTLKNHLLLRPRPFKILLLSPAVLQGGVVHSSRGIHTLTALSWFGLPNTISEKRPQGNGVRMADN